MLFSVFMCFIPCHIIILRCSEWKFIEKPQLEKPVGEDLHFCSANHLILETDTFLMSRTGYQVISAIIVNNYSWLVRKNWIKRGGSSYLFKPGFSLVICQVDWGCIEAAYLSPNILPGSLLLSQALVLKVSLARRKAHERSGFGAENRKHRWVQFLSSAYPFHSKDPKHLQFDLNQARPWYWIVFYYLVLL